jgi:hypothetical protein
MKNGTPRREVMTPMGISWGANSVLAAVSHNNRKIAPVSAETGISLLWSGPVMKRTACGMMRPTKPIVPQKHTLIAVTNEATNRSSFFKADALIPRETAVSSPVESMFRLPALNNRTKEPIRIKGSMTRTVFQLEPVMLPIVQNIIRWACSLEAMMIRDNREEHKKPMAIPDKIKILVDRFPFFWAIK